MRRGVAVAVPSLTVVAEDCVKTWTRLLFDPQVEELVRDLERMAALGVTRVGGDIFVDGVLGAAYTPGVLRAALDRPYADEPLGYSHLLVPDDVLETFIPRLLERGWQLAFHAVDDRALRHLLRAAPSTTPTRPAPLRRWRPSRSTRETRRWPVAGATARG